MDEVTSHGLRAPCHRGIETMSAGCILMLFNPFALANVSVLADATVPLMQVQAAATGRRPYFNSKPNFSDSLSVVSKHKTAILWCGWEQSWAMCDAHVFAHPAVPQFDVALAP